MLVIGTTKSQSALGYCSGAQLPDTASTAQFDSSTLDSQNQINGVHWLQPTTGNERITGSLCTDRLFCKIFNRRRSGLDGFTTIETASPISQTMDVRHAPLVSHDW